MRVLIVGKCPPIQGGVSWRTLRTACALTELGCDVDLVTNADEVEPEFRTAFTEGDSEYLESLGSTRLKIHQITSLTDQHRHIPYSPSFADRLYGAACRAIENSRPNLIMGWYFWPYGLVAARLKAKYDIPMVMTHAGSDLGRISYHEDAEIAIRDALSLATFVITGQKRQPQDRLFQLGVDPGQMITIKGFPAPHESLFQGKGISWASLTELAKCRNTEIDTLDLPIYDTTTFTLSAPIVGTYGKIGEVKGTYDLLRAVELSAKTNHPMQLAIVASGWLASLRELRTRIDASPILKEYVRVYPPIAPWRIGGFIRLCDAVCHLERGFDVSHAPNAAVEMVLSGQRFLCSGEIARKPLIQRAASHVRPFTICEDPRKHSLLVDCLRKTLASPREIKYPITELSGNDADPLASLLAYLAENCSGFSRSKITPHSTSLCNTSSDSSATDRL